MEPHYHPIIISTLPSKAEKYAAFQKLVDQGKSEQEAIQILCLTSKAKTGPENYQWLQQLWTGNQWSTFVDILEWYNDLDVTPNDLSY